MIEFTCIYCGQQVRTEEASAGKQIECPGCGHSVRVRQRKLGDALKPTGEADEEKQREACAWEEKSDREIVERLLPKAMTEKELQAQKSKKALSLLAPRYDDLTLFALSLSFLLLWSVDAELRADLAKAFVEKWAAELTIWLAVAVIGMVLSLVNVFLRREKSDVEKSAMLVFAVVVTAATGLYAGFIMLQQSRGWLLVFPLWNLLNVIPLLLLYRLGVVDTDCIVDEPASFAQVVLTAICIPILLAVCHYCLELHWTITFSIAVAYTMSLHNGIRNVFGMRRPAPNVTQNP